MSDIKVRSMFHREVQDVIDFLGMESAEELMKLFPPKSEFLAATINGHIAGFMVYNIAQRSRHPIKVYRDEPVDSAHRAAIYALAINPDYKAHKLEIARELLAKAEKNIKKSTFVCIVPTKGEPTFVLDEQLLRDCGFRAARFNDDVGVVLSRGPVPYADIEKEEQDIRLMQRKELRYAIRQPSKYDDKIVFFPSEINNALEHEGADLEFQRRVLRRLFTRGGISH